MNLPSRSLGLALLLLLLFLGATVGLQWWLHRETVQLQAVATEAAQARLAHAVAIGNRPAAQWDRALLDEFGAVVGARVELVGDAGPRPPAAGSAIVFSQALPGSPGWALRATLAPSALVRVQILHQRMLVLMVLLALLLALVPLLFVLLDPRRTLAQDGSSRSPWAAVRAQAAGMEHYAKISHERTVALAEEHGARVRAEEDLQVNRTLLDQSVDRRIRLGRDLHDNICQTLYAVCLTLESVQKKNALAPELQQRVNQCLLELRRLNQEVRAFLQELEPAHIQGQSFADALAGLTDAFATQDGVQIQPRLDAEAVALIPLSHVAEIMNILREAVSNGVRHGGARHLTVRAGRNDQSVVLAVQDDGCGFAPNPARSAPGHGLVNMQARAAALGGSLRVDSTPGKGTRVLLTLPVASNP